MHVECTYLGFNEIRNIFRHEKFQNTLAPATENNAPDTKLFQNVACQGNDILLIGTEWSVRNRKNHFALLYHAYAMSSSCTSGHCFSLTHCTQNMETLHYPKRTVYTWFLLACFVYLNGAPDASIRRLLRGICMRVVNNL